MAFVKGHKLSIGRPKGSKNRINKDIRQVFHEVYEQIGENRLSEETGLPMTGQEFMVEWARDNPTEFYRLYSKMIPTKEEMPEDQHEDFIDELVLEDEIKYVEAKQVGEIALIMPPSGETKTDNAPCPKKEADLV